MAFDGRAPLVLALGMVACGPTIMLETDGTDSEATDTEVGGTTPVDPDGPVPTPPATSTSTTATTLDGTESDSDTATTGVGCGVEPGWDWDQWVGGWEVGNDYGYAIVGLGDGVVVVGSRQVDSRLFEPLLQRYSDAGDLLWEVAGPPDMQGAGLAQLPNGDLVVCGSRGYAADDASFMWLAGFDLDGNQQWDHLYGGQECWDLATTTSGEIVTVGAFEGFEAASVRYTPTGDPHELWVDQLAGANGFYRVATDGEDVLMLQGLGLGAGFRLLRLDANHQQLWAVDHATTGVERLANDLAVDAAGNIIAAGFVDHSSADQGSDIMVWSFDPQGQIQWLVDHDLEGRDDNADGLYITPSGEIIITGYMSLGAGWELLVAGLGPRGDLWWWDFHPRSGQHRGFGVAQDACGAVYSVGYAYNGDDNDLWLGRFVL